MALAAVDPTTEVTTSGLSRVAGRDVYELILTPRDDATLVRQVVVALDAETMVPLRTQVLARAASQPALEVGFTSVDFSAPDSNLFEFTPPPGATVTEHPATHEADKPDKDATAGADREPTVMGEGWSAVAIMQLPPNALADLAESGERADDEWGSPEASAAALAMLEALPRQSGDWGSGRVLAGTLFSAILTDDGRVAVGAVAPETLMAALAAR
jgi:hypothetical protein